MRTLIALCAASLSVGCLPGCKVHYTQPTTQPRALSGAEKDFQAVWQASRETLGKYHFELDREDRRAGVITTEPLTGMHFFEFWRHDAARPADFGESTIQTIYRTAKVTVGPVKPGAKTYKAQVDVLLRRSDKGTPHVSSASEAFGLFTSRHRVRRRAPLLEPDRARRRKADYVELGHDRSLEARLTADIAARADRLRGR
ncbi:MAG TPA: hypothetical protein VM031_02330 [Phycisphaerae bacterium]|nr:hypothetical protein [Phycisphaerae bacterium]